MNISKLIQSHKGLQSFNYDITVDWAIDLLNSGIETENIAILASFSKPVNSWEIELYVSAVLKDLGLAEKEGREAKVWMANYHLNEILDNRLVRSNLQSLYELCLQCDYEFGLMPFYLLYLGWKELDELGVNFYYEGAEKSNMERIIKDQAKIWLDKHIAS